MITLLDCVYFYKAEKHPLARGFLTFSRLAEGLGVKFKLNTVEAWNRQGPIPMFA